MMMLKINESSLSLASPTNRHQPVDESTNRDTASHKNLDDIYQPNRAQTRAQRSKCSSIAGKTLLPHLLIAGGGCLVMLKINETSSSLSNPIELL
ncbi:hypothetical protein [Planococcus sp. SSTMD024]|uniref:hypothetical protein n=1 Tax=Planococcus sp. SSTMD024 TaxID=3242163 RepID=UPI00351EF334